MNVLMLGSIAYQFHPEGEHIIVNTISWRFPLAALQNTVLVNLLSGRHYILTFILALFLVYYTIPRMSSCVREDVPVKSVPHRFFHQLFIYAPFALYKGSVVTLLVLSMLKAFSTEILAEIVAFFAL